MDASNTGTLLDALVLSHGFRVTPAGPIGVRHGLPVRVDEERAPQRNNQKVLRISIGTATSEAAASAVASVKDQKKSLPTKLLGADAMDRGLVVDLPAKLLNGPTDEALEALDVVLQTVASVPGSVPSPPDDAQLSTIDGIPLFLTAADREAIAAEVQAAAEAYASLRPNLVGGLLGAGVGAVITAAVWALLLAYAEIQAWFVAIGGGLLIAFLAVWIGRKAVLPLQIAIFVLTVAAVLVGEILGWALVIQREFGIFDLSLAFEAYQEFADTTDTLFALVGGLIGAFFGIRATAKPSFERQIDVH